MYVRFEIFACKKFVNVEMNTFSLCFPLQSVLLVFCMFNEFFCLLEAVSYLRILFFILKFYRWGFTSMMLAWNAEQIVISCPSLSYWTSRDSFYSNNSFEWFYNQVVPLCNLRVHVFLSQPCIPYWILMKNDF